MFSLPREDGESDESPVCGLRICDCLGESGVPLKVGIKLGRVLDARLRTGVVEGVVLRSSSASNSLVLTSS